MTCIPSYTRTYVGLSLVGEHSRVSSEGDDDDEAEERNGGLTEANKCQQIHIDKEQQPPVWTMALCACE